MATEADQDSDDTWILALESVLPDCLDDEEVINITRGRILPEEYRAQIWHLCLGGASKICTFSHFDGIFDLQEQSVIREECKSLVDKLGNEDEDKVTILCNLESIFTHYCKSRNVKFDKTACWTDLLLPLLAAKMPADSAAFCFQEILERYVPRETQAGAPIYHLLRLLLLYHDPELSTFLDSRKINPDLYATKWIKSLFASSCDLEAVSAVWDVYLTEKDPFFILFLALVILVNAREQILAMEKENRAVIIQQLATVPANLRVQDVRDFCALARFYVLRTPRTYRTDYEREIFGSVFLGGEKKKKKKRKKKKKKKEEEEEEEEEEEKTWPQEEEEEEEEEEEDLPLSQSLCLSVSAEEILEMSHFVADDDYDQVRFFLVDCRPPDHYNSGHLTNSFHLDATLMLHHPPQFTTAVQGLLLSQRCAVLSGVAGEHLCFIGAGREQSDSDLNMVLSYFLQRGEKLVSVAKGGYAALHQCLGSDLALLSDHNAKQCLVCSPAPSMAVHQSAPTSQPGDLSANGSAVFQPQTSTSGLTNRLASFSSVFKSRSTEMREKLFDYITNPNGLEQTTITTATTTTATTTTTTATATTTTTTPTTRHISSGDRGKLYRQGDVFSIEDEDDSTYEEGRGGGGGGGGEEEAEENMEKINLKDLLKRPEVIASFNCQQVKENGKVLKSVLVLMDKTLIVVRQTPSCGRLVARRNLASVVKITSKKRHPNFITFKYGAADDDDELIVSDMDRFVIPHASHATKLIKEQIIKEMQTEKH